MPSGAAVVKKLKKIIDTRGLVEGEEFLHSGVWNFSDPSFILPFMLMRDYRAGTEHLDEMWLVIHAVESYPKEVYIRELVANIEVLSEKSPYLVNHLIHRIKNTEADLECFLGELRRNRPARTDCIMAVLEKVKQQSDENVPEKVADVERIMAVLRE